MHPVLVDVENHSLESESMGVIKLDSYILIVRGKDRVSFIDGLSTNKIDGDCATVFTTKTAKVIDLVDVILMEDYLAIVGYGPYKENLLNHISSRILGQDVNIGDATSNNSVYLSDSDIIVTPSVTKRSTWRGWLLIAPNSEDIEETIREAINRQLPYVLINELLVSAVPNTNEVNVSLEFSVSIEPDTFDTITFNFNIGDN